MNPGKHLRAVMRLVKYAQTYDLVSKDHRIWSEPGVQVTSWAPLCPTRVIIIVNIVVVGIIGIVVEIAVEIAVANAAVEGAISPPVPFSFEGPSSDGENGGAEANTRPEAKLLHVGLSMQPGKAITNTRKTRA